MDRGYFKYPTPANEPIKDYAPGSPEKASLKAKLAELKAETRDVPMVINGEEVRSGDTVSIHPPHEIAHNLGSYHKGDESHVNAAIKAAMNARQAWGDMPWQERAAIFLRAAELTATKYRDEINAATMLCQSKNAFQAEIDAACELADFLRFNVHFLSEIYRQQPVSGPGVHNRTEYRPLEGFVLAISPFNFTAIGGNLVSAPAMCGNVVVWKPSRTQIYSAHVTMKIFMEAGLPEGVINLIYTGGSTVGEVAFNHPDFAGVHFTGSTGVFNSMWNQMGNSIHNKTYKTYPRIVGETGGKDFIVAHKSADPSVVSTAIIRGSFEYAGQKCSAASRAYIPSNIAEEVKAKLVATTNELKMGSVEDFTNFVNAVIDEASFDNIMGYLEGVKKDPDSEVLVGGNGDKSKGYFVEPTIIESKNPKSTTMCEEIFGPVMTIYVYDADDFEGCLDLVDSTSEYALTGAVIATDRDAVNFATVRLQNAAGNFYINDKCTGAVVGQQPFGGARASGTNDKAGSMLNLYRWLSARTVKETLVPPTDYRYPFMAAE